MRMVGKLGWFHRGNYGDQADRRTVQAREERAWRSEVDDDLRPCKGRNGNICVAEGCFGDDCISPAVLRWRLRDFIEKHGDDNPELLDELLD